MVIVVNIFKAVLVSYLLCFAALVVADSILPIDESYSAGIPKPEVELGFQPGQWHARPEQITRYMERLAETSDRASLQIIGHTTEKRPLLHLIISSPEDNDIFISYA